MHFFYNCLTLYSQPKKTKKKITFVNSNSNHRRERKLVPVYIDYCLFQFHALKIFLGIRLHSESLPNFNFFNVKPQILPLNRKVRHSNCLDINFHKISDFNMRAIRRKNYY